MQVSVCVEYFSFSHEKKTVKMFMYASDGKKGKEQERTRDKKRKKERMNKTRK